jgi:hypothetical protein
MKIGDKVTWQGLETRVVATSGRDQECLVEWYIDQDEYTRARRVSSRWLRFEEVRPLKETEKKA